MVIVGILAVYGKSACSLNFGAPTNTGHTAIEPLDKCRGSAEINQLVRRSNEWSSDGALTGYEITKVAKLSTGTADTFAALALAVRVQEASRNYPSRTCAIPVVPPS
jgi:hypothetical protein